jgi:hypothetical protein
MLNGNCLKRMDIHLICDAMADATVFAFHFQATSPSQNVIFFSLWNILSWKEEYNIHDKKKRVKLSLWQTVETNRVVRRRGSQIF